MNNDGFNDIVFQSTNGYLYVYNRNGTRSRSCRASRTARSPRRVAECSPIVADINGDGFNDVSVGDEAGELTAISGMRRHGAARLPDPARGRGARHAGGAPTSTGDGMTEIVVADWDKNIYVWDYDFPFQPNGEAPWPQFHHDPRRTGLANSVLYLGADGPSGGETAVRELELAPPSPNPAYARSRLWFGVPVTLAGGTYDLSIFDLGGRRVRHVDSGDARAGRFSLEWDLRDDGSRPVRGGVYFARFAVGGHAVTRKLVVVQ